MGKNGSTNSREVLGFEFQEIPLEEAMNVVIAGDGSYADIKQTLLEKLPALPKDKAFAFGLPGGKEVPEDQRRGLCMTINKTLRKAKIGWRITYSGMKKLFICIPQTKSGATPGHTNGYAPKSKIKGLDVDEILKLRDSGLSVNKIIETTKFPPGRVKYVCYQKAPGKRDAPPSQSGEVGRHSISEIEKVACSTFRISPDVLRGQRIGIEATKIRKAILFLAVRRYGTKMPKAAKYFGLATSTIYGINGDASQIPDTIKQLESAI